MPLPRIPTFEELLKRVRQPKVPELEELDDTQASEFGYNLPPNWRLRRLGGVDSLISPRGLTFRDIKMDEGKITDFQAFRGDKPVRLPQPIVPVEPPPVEPPPEEPPPIEPSIDTRTAQADVEARIGRKLTTFEIYGTQPIPELGNRYFTQALTREFLEQPITPPIKVTPPPVEPLGVKPIAPPERTIPTFEEWSATKGFDKTRYAEMLRGRGVAETDIPSMLETTWNELKAVYEYEHNLGRWATVAGGLEKAAVSEPETLWEAAKVFGESLTRLPTQVAASVLQATQGEGGASVVNPDWADRLIAEASADIDKFTKDISEQYPDKQWLTEIAQVSRNLAFSITSMGAGLGTGVPIALAPVPGARVAAWTAGTAASGYVAYQMTTYQIVQQYLELKDAESREQRGRGLTLQEENQLKQEFSTLATKYGLWEAVPEALSNLTFGLLLGPLGNMIGGPMAVQIIAKLAGIYGEELLTETITQKGQSAIEVEAGLREDRIGWVEAFKEIAPQTFLLTTILAGTGAVSVATYNRIKTSLKTEVGEDSQVYQEFDENIRVLMESQLSGEIAEQILQRGAIEQGGLPVQPEGVTPAVPAVPEVVTDIQIPRAPEGEVVSSSVVQDAQRLTREEFIEQNADLVIKEKGRFGTTHYALKTRRHDYQLTGQITGDSSGGALGLLYDRLQEAAVKPPAVEVAKPTIKPVDEGAIRKLQKGRGAMAHSLTEFVTPENLARRAMYEAQLAAYGNRYGDIDLAQRDVEAARTINEREFGGISNRVAIEAIRKAEEAISQVVGKPPTPEVAKPPVEPTISRVAEVPTKPVVPKVAPPAEPIIPPTEPIAKGVVPSTQGMKDLGAKEKVRPARKVLTRIGQWRGLFKPTQRAEVELHEEQIAKSKTFDRWQKLLGKDKARWALVSDEINKKGSVPNLTDNEKRVVDEYRRWADEWADRKDLPQTKRIKDYMPHLFEQEATRQIKEEGGIDPVLAQMLSQKVTRKITDPFLKKRLGAVGWVKDPVAAARAYEAVSLKFAYYTPLLNKIDTMLADPNIPQSIKNYLSGYSKRMTGELSEIDKSANVTIREFAEKIKNIPVIGDFFYPRMTQGNPMGMASYHLTGGLYALFLGYKATSAIRNLSQHTLILGEVGAKHFANGIRLRLTREGRGAMKKSLVLRSRKFAYTAGLDSSFANRWTDKFRETALYMFRLADRQNVSDAFLAGYSEAKELYPEAGEQVWIDRGDEVAADTQYLYTKMNSMSFAQSAPGRTMSMLTTWTENWMELMTKWINRTPSQVYLEQERLTGKAPPTKNWSQTYKAIALYTALVGLAFAFDDQTRFKIKEYTGVGSLRYLAGAVGGEFPAMEAIGSVADMVAGFLTDDERMLNSGLAEFKSTFTPGVIRQLNDVGSGEKDYSTLLFYLEAKDFQIKNLKDKWEKGWEEYPIFEDADERRGFLLKNKSYMGLTDAKMRNKWREENPLLEAQMFVASQFTTLSSDKARTEALKLIEKHKLDTELIDGYEKIFGIDTKAELQTFEDRIGNFEKLVVGEEAKYFTLSNYAFEVNKLVRSMGRAKVQSEASPLTSGILEAQDTIEAYDVLKEGDARILWRKQYPEAEAWMFLLGRVTSFQSFKGAEMARDLMEKYDIPIEWLEFPKRTLKRTGKASVTPVNVFSGFGAARPRRATPTYPTFPKPRISRGIGVRAPTVPGF